MVVSYFRKLTNSVSPSQFIEDMNLKICDSLTDGEGLPNISLHPGVASDEIQTFSASEIITYSICPHMYLLRELWGYQPELDQALGYGNGLHFCLKRAGDMVMKGGQRPVDAVETSVDQDFHMPFVGGAVLDNYRDSARKRLVEFAKKHGDDFKRIEEVEYRLRIPR